MRSKYSSLAFNLNIQPGPVPRADSPQGSLDFWLPIWGWVMQSYQRCDALGSPTFTDVAYGHSMGKATSLWRVNCEWDPEQRKGVGRGRMRRCEEEETEREEKTVKTKDLLLSQLKSGSFLKCLLPGRHNSNYASLGNLGPKPYNQRDQGCLLIM